MPVSGVVYALPRTRVDVTVTYTVKSTTLQKNGVAAPTAARSASIKTPVTVTPVLVADDDNRFILSGEGLAKDGRLDSNFKFAVNDKQLLTSVSADLTDKSPETFQSLVGAAISIAKIAAVAGADPVEDDYAARIGVLDTKIIAVSRADGKDRMKEMKALIDERALLVGALEKYREANSPVVAETAIPYTVSLNLDVLVAGGTQDIKAPASLLGIPDAAVPVVRVTLACSTEQKANAALRVFAGSAEKPKDGVYYRVPSPARLQLALVKGNDTIPLFDAPVTFAHFGAIHYVEARYKMWARRKTTINFSEATGSLRDYGVESTSSAAAAATALDASLGKVQEAVAELKKQKEEAAAKVQSDDDKKLAALEQKQKLLDAELGVLKSEKALAKEKAGDAPDGGNE